MDEAPPSCEHLFHYHRRGTEPFGRITALPRDEALALMRARHLPGSVLWDRFGEPERYLQLRLHTERWLREAFVEKGGAPRDAQPVYFVLGESRWLERVADARTREEVVSLRVALADIPDAQVSFTYPDSMISLYLSSQRDARLYEPRYHGRVFTRGEMLAIVAERGLPELRWTAELPDAMPHYVEAQVWDRALLR